MGDKTLVVQHNKIIEAKYKLSVTEQRLIKLLVSMIEKDDEDFKKYVIRVADLAELLGIKSGDIYPAIDKAVTKLNTTPLKFRDGTDTVTVTWLSSSRYQHKQGQAILRFDPELKPLLLQLKDHFTAYELGNIIRLKHTHSIRLYELLKQYERIGRRRFLLGDLRDILAIGENEYKQYRDFKRWVIKVAQNELSNKTDISFEWNEEKVKRVCVAIEFIIKPQKRPKNGENNQEYIKAEKIEDTRETKQQNSTINKMVAIGVTKNKAEELLRDYGEENIQEKIVYVLALEKDGKVKNPAGFLVEAIRSGYLDSQAKERSKKEKALHATKLREEHTQKWDRLKKAYTEAKNAKFEAWRLTLSEQDLKEHREKYMETVNPIFKKRGGILEKMFIGYLKNLVPQPSLRDWAGQSGLDISEFEKELAQEERQASIKPANQGIAA